MTKPTTVLICDDSAVIRSLFRDLLSGEEDIEVIGTATDPYDAREKIKELNPDVLTLDIEMPKMDGLSFLEKIMSLRPMPVIMVSSLTQKGAAETIRALEIGAVDYISKPIDKDNRNLLRDLKEELVAKVRQAAKANLGARNYAKPLGQGQIVTFTPPKTRQRIIAIGSSTGGVEALRDIFLRLPSNCPPIVMAQHMPESFTTSFAKRLDGLSEISVSEAASGMPLKPGTAYLARGGRHLRVLKKPTGYVCQLYDGDLVSGHRPSVDVLFESVAEVVGKDAIGAILTGMGRDGANGLLKMRQAGARTLGQNKASCIVYGMPKVAFEQGAVEREVPLNDMAREILHLCEQED